MRRTISLGAMLFGLWVSLTADVAVITAQGPAGVGASAAAQDSSHSMNPIKWIKKDSKNSTEGTENRSELEKKLTPSLQAQGVLSASATAADACAPFRTLEGCLAALHASHNLGVDFNCLRANVTGVHTSVNVSSCRVADGEKAHSLSNAIRQLKPDANSKQANKDAEQQAKDDLKAVGG